jgi:hypothetical protein
MISIRRACIVLKRTKRGIFLLRTTKRKRPRNATNESMGKACARSMNCNVCVCYVYYVSVCVCDFVVDNEEEEAKECDE